MHHDSRGRYSIHELLHQYGEEYLNQDTNEAEKIHNRHCSYYADFLTKLWEYLKGAKQKEALSQIDNELENVRVYWDWAIHHTSESEIAPVLNTLWRFYDQGSRYQEGEQAFAKAAASASEKGNRLLRGQILARQGALLNSIDKPIEAKAILQESLRILEQFDSPIDYAFCLIEMGRVVLQRDEDMLQARDYLHASCAAYEAISDKWGMGNSLLWLGLT